MSSDLKYSRYDIATHIFNNLATNKESLSTQWQESMGGINHFYLDDLLPTEMVLDIRKAFPSDTKSLFLRKSLRELKFVAAQMDKHNQLLEEIVYAFQDERVVEIIGEITKLEGLEPDSLLYAGGISMMAQNHFLNPHLDNSHDKNRQRYRVANLLFYVTPNWELKNGGNLELWPNGPTKKQITIESKFNRLVVMITNDKSWHSVSKVYMNETRCCISNYYFSKKPANKYQYFHITSFRGRPEQRIRDLCLRLDSLVRMGIRKIFPLGIVDTKHYYKKSN